MKRSLIVLCVAALLATLPLARIADAAKPQKVAICHVTQICVWKGGGYGYVAFGREIEVSESAVAEHEAHGDNTTFKPMTESDRFGFEVLGGLNVRNANTWFFFD